MSKVDVDSICSALCKAVLNTEIKDAVISKDSQNTTDLLNGNSANNNGK